MPPEQPPRFSNKFLGVILVGLLTTLFGGIGVMYYLGMFSEVKVTQTSAPSYRIAYLFHTGAYNDIEPSIKKVDEFLKKAGVNTDTPCALLLDNTGNTPESQRRAKVGYLLKHGDVVPAPLDEEIFPGRNIVSAKFSGGTLIGSYKAYEAMKKWAKVHHYTLTLPALEIYHPNGVKEYQLGIRK
jgi:effector-binding domain-containing protein